jgi:hypothetical protein
MGFVVLAHDTQLDRLVALKVPTFRGAERDTLRERFLREARAAATLSHPNLCPVFDVGEVDNIPYLTMAYIDGAPLSEIIKGGQLAATQAARWAQEIALAVHEAHQRGIIHRDLKPSNIMVNQAGQPIVMDFGLAYRGIGAGDVRLTQSGVIVGTPAYMAPEQMGGEGQAIGPGSDIYSLGVVLYEMLTGRLPFQAGTIGKLLAQIDRDPPPPLSQFRPGLDGALERVCLIALAKRPEERFASMTEFAAALAPFTRSCTSAGMERTSAVSQPPAGGRGVRRWWTGLRAGVVLRWQALARRFGSERSKGDAPPAPTRATTLSPEECGPDAHDAQLVRQQARRRRFRLGVVVLVLFALLGYVGYRLSTRSGGTTPTVTNPFITWENYAKIKPDMSEWDVGDLLGPGTLKRDDGHVGPDGNYRQWSHGEWRSGEKVISITFFNGKVSTKESHGLFGN